MKKRLLIIKQIMWFFTFLAFSIFCLYPQPASAQVKEQKSGRETSLTILKDEVLSYFEPVTGNIVSVEGSAVKIDIGSKRAVKAGMRFYAFKEGAPFLHPITKEPLGKIETPIGNIAIRQVSANDSTAIIIKGKPEDFLNAKVKVAGTKIRVLFYQGNVDWFLGDSYYQMLKESGRFELVDTGIETEDMTKIISEARSKGAEAVIVLHSQDMPEHLNLTQRLYWSADSQQFSAKNVPVDIAYVKELKFKSGIFGAKEGDILLFYQLPFGARRLAAGDLDGDGNPDIIIARDNKISVYSPGVDLKLLWEFKVTASDILWVDTIDLNKNRRDEILITSMLDGSVISYIYELQGANFVQLHKLNDTFIRRLDRSIIGQKHSKADGYSGKVFSIIYADGKYRAGDNLKLPPDINIFDFQFLHSPDGRQAILAWDDNGFLNLYDERGARLWNSKEGFGGFSLSFKKETLSGMVDKGKWSIKDRLLVKGNEVLAPKRKTLFGYVKGLGFSSSELKSFWWSGISLEEGMFIEAIDGDVLDYAIVGDRILVLSKPLFGIRAKNILKGENPLGTMLYIFSLKGR